MPAVVVEEEDATERIKPNSESSPLDMVHCYFILFRFTEQGIRNAKDITRRAAAAGIDAEKIGGKLTLYWTFGEYDGIGILEAPNNEAAMEFNLKVGSLDNYYNINLHKNSNLLACGKIINIRNIDRNDVNLYYLEQINRPRCKKCQGFPKSFPSSSK